MSRNRKELHDCGELENHFAFLEDLSVRDSSVVHFGFTQDLWSLCAVVMLDLETFCAIQCFISAKCNSNMFPRRIGKSAYLSDMNRYV